MPLQVDLVQPDDPDAGRLVRAQMLELMQTWHYRAVSEDEVDTELGPHAAPGVVVLALARREGQAVGCAGLRVVGTTGELTKVFVVPVARGTGVGEAVITAVEEAARARRLRVMRLDIRADLPAPARLYRRLGYREVAPWHDGPCADHFFTTDL